MPYCGIREQNVAPNVNRLRTAFATERRFVAAPKRRLGAASTSVLPVTEALTDNPYLSRSARATFLAVDA
jgi:hypothetical protein